MTTDRAESEGTESLTISSISMTMAARDMNNFIVIHSTNDVHSLRPFEINCLSLASIVNSKAFLQHHLGRVYNMMNFNRDEANEHPMSVVSQGEEEGLFVSSEVVGDSMHQRRCEERKLLSPWTLDFE